MTDSITVSTFVVGLLLLIASLIGKELKIAAVRKNSLAQNVPIFGQSFSNTGKVLNAAPGLLCH